MKNHFHWYKKNMLKKLKFDFGDKDKVLGSLFFRTEIRSINITA